MGVLPEVCRICSHVSPNEMRRATRRPMWYVRSYIFFRTMTQRKAGGVARFFLGCKAVTIIPGVFVFVYGTLDVPMQGHQAAAAAAAEEVQRLKTDLEATQALLEGALQEKAAADALLRTEQGRGGVSFREQK